MSNYLGFNMYCDILFVEKIYVLLNNCMFLLNCFLLSEGVLVFKVC